MQTIQLRRWESKVTGLIVDIEIVKCRIGGGKKEPKTERRRRTMRDSTDKEMVATVSRIACAIQAKRKSQMKRKEGYCHHGRRAEKQCPSQCHDAKTKKPSGRNP